MKDLAEAVLQLVEQSSSDPKFVGLNLTSTDTKKMIKVFARLGSGCGAVGRRVDLKLECLNPTSTGVTLKW